jgi:Ca2+-binding RTX toxin-like protein
MARQAWGVSRFKAIATLIGATGILAFAAPGTAWGDVTTDYDQRELSVISDQASDRIVVTCSSGEVNLNGQTLQIPCTEPDFLVVDGSGGNDAIDLAGVTRAAGFALKGRDFFQGTAVSEINGGDGADEIVGTGYPDRFGFELFGSGPDTIHAGPGGDAIVGTTASDRIFGEGGNDPVIYCEGGNDRANGGPGADWIYGYTGDDRLVGGTGNDLLDGEDGADVLYGNRGSDELWGGRGNDRLFGGWGLDYLKPGTGRNTVHQ